jgi:hypothetical protein
VNGFSGQIGGIRLASQRKGWRWAGLLVGAGVLTFLAALLLFALTAVLPTSGLFGAFLAFIAFVLGVTAIIPAAWPWQWNRSQTERKVRRQ